MSNQGYNNQTISQYLLGVLPAAEAEAFDELSVTDEEFAGRLNSAEKELVDAYVQGELNGQTLEKFESHYLSSPRRREKVEFARAFHLFLEKGAREQAVPLKAESSAPKKALEKAGWFAWLKRGGTGRLAWQWGAACAVLAMVIVCGWLLFENRRLSDQAKDIEARRNGLSIHEQELQKDLEGERSSKTDIEKELARVRDERARLEEELKQQAAQHAAEIQRIANQRQTPTSGGGMVAFVLMPQMRGGGQIQTLSIPAGTASAVMQLQLEPNDYAVYQVTLLDLSTGQTQWQSGRLKARKSGESKVLVLSLPASLLKPETYQLRVSGLAPDNSAEIISDYSFRVVK